MFESIQSFFKVALNILSLNQILHYDMMFGNDLGLNHLNNRNNKEMNNIMSIDFAMRDILDDSDTLVPRMSQEFPRIND
jgi:hypothetical protein